MPTRCFCPPELGRVAVAQFGKTNQGEQFVDPRVHLGRAALAGQLHREADVAGHGARLQQVEVLEHHADALALLLQCPGGRVVRSTPPPAPALVGRSSRLMQRISVLLPAPERPMTPKISPACTLRVTWSRASVAAEAPRRLA
jgi:hypothetical protein